MSLKGYDQLRMYKQCLIYMVVQWGVNVDGNYIKSLHVSAEYQKYIYSLLEKTFPDESVRMKKKKELEQSLPCLILDGSYFNWLRDSERVACFAWFYIEKEKTQFIDETVIKSHFKGISHSYENKSHPVPPVFINKTGPYDMSHFEYIYSSGVYANEVSSDSDYVLAVMKHVDDLFLTLPEKIIYINNMRNEWLKQYNTFMDPFSWLNEKDETACIWAWDYMNKNNFHSNNSRPGPKQLKSFVIAAFDNFSDSKAAETWMQKQNNKKESNAMEGMNSVTPASDNKENIQQSKFWGDLSNFHKQIQGNESALHTYKTAFLKGMKNAWAQKKYKEKNQGKTKKEARHVSFEFDIITMIKLKSLANTYKINEQDMIKKLIDESSELLKKNVKTVH
ncbi:hypothetical protein [Citrobacter arsenatis]|uniref:hypothetical protein n=1 Tax=Citrobacter arsenatis TaxID=2546350 RepID=UPI00300DF113